MAAPSNTPPPSSSAPPSSAAPAAVRDVTDQASAGLGKLKGQWMDFAGNLMAPIAILAAGGTKTQAAWAGLKDVLLSKVLGPLGMVAGAATGFLLLTKKLITEWRTMGVQSAKAIETLTLQFKPLLGNMELAKKRAREVFAFSVKSPFKFAELAAGNKVLEGLTRGALSGKAGMELVGDASAVAGAGFEETARSVGRLYDGIMSGRPVGEAGMRLQELGLISGQTRNQIEAMTAANAAGSSIWSVVSKDIERTKGAMNDLSASLEGLESTYEDTRIQLEAGFGQGFLEGEKASVKAATAVLDAMTPVAKTLGEVIGNVSNGWEAFKARITGVITAIPGFSTVVGVAVTAVTGLAATLTLATGGLIAKFALGLVSAGNGVGKLKDAVETVTAVQKAATGAAGMFVGAQEAAAGVTDVLTKAEEIQQTVTENLAKAKAAFAAMQKAVTAGTWREAGAQAKLTIVNTAAAVRTNALAVSKIGLATASRVAWAGIKLVTASIWQMTMAILATPMFWIAAALVAAGAAMAYFYNETKKAREELEAYASASKAVAENLDAQARAIRTVADLRKTEADVLRELTAAYLELQQAQAAGDKDREKIAQEKIGRLNTTKDKVQGMTGKTELSEEQVSREDAAKARAKEAALAQGDDKASRGEQSTVEVARERQAKGEALRVAAEQGKAEQERVAAMQQAIQRRDAEARVQEPSLVARQARVKEKMAARSAAAPSAQSNVGLSPEAMKTVNEANARDGAADIKELEEVEAALKRIADIKSKTESQSSQVALESGSELAVLQEKLKIYGELQTAADDLKAAERAKVDAEGIKEDGPDKQKKMAEAQMALEAAKRRDERAKQQGAGAGVEGISPENRQQMERRVTELKSTQAEDTDPVAKLARDKAVRDAELGLTQARLDAESQVASLRLKGYEREKAMLDFERQKLAAKEKAGVIDATALAQQKALLDAQAAALEKSAAEKRQELKDAFQIAGLSRKEDAARTRGDTVAADALRKEQDAIADERTRRDAMKEAQDSGYAPEDYAKKQVAEAQAARAQERAKQEAERQLGRDRSEANQGSASAGINARAAEMQGRSKEAKKIREDAARAQDEVDRREKQKSYREQGFSGEKADAMATKDVKTAQAERMMQEMMGGKGSVIASSLAQVGGGGNVTGSDPSVKLQERMVKLLEELNDSTKENVETMR